MFVAASIRDADGGTLAVLAFRVNPERDFAAILARGRIGLSGETYAFDTQGLLLSPTRFDEQMRAANLLGPDEVAWLNFEIRDPGVNLLEAGTIPQVDLPLTHMAAEAYLLQSVLVGMPAQIFHLGSVTADDERHIRKAPRRVEQTLAIEIRRVEPGGAEAYGRRSL